MKSLLPVLSIIVAVALHAIPAFADDYVYGWPRNTNFPNFDPGAAAINALNATSPRGGGSIDFGLVEAMGRNGGSFMEHQLRCQAKYVTYDMTSDTFIDNSGMPRRCKL